MTTCREIKIYNTTITVDIELNCIRSFKYQNSKAVYGANDAELLAQIVKELHANDITTPCT